MTTSIIDFNSNLYVKDLQLKTSGNQTISTESGNLIFNPSTNIDFNSKNVVGGASIECSTITTDGVSNL